MVGRWCGGGALAGVAGDEETPHRSFLRRDGWKMGDDVCIFVAPTIALLCHSPVVITSTALCNNIQVRRCTGMRKGKKGFYSC